MLEWQLDSQHELVDRHSYNYMTSVRRGSDVGLLYEPYMAFLFRRNFYLYLFLSLFIYLFYTVVLCRFTVMLTHGMLVQLQHSWDPDEAASRTEL